VFKVGTARRAVRSARHSTRPEKQRVKGGEALKNSISVTFGHLWSSLVIVPIVAGAYKLDDKLRHLFAVLVEAGRSYAC